MLLLRYPVLPQAAGLKDRIEELQFKLDAQRREESTLREKVAELQAKSEASLPVSSLGAWA